MGDLSVSYCRRRQNLCGCIQGLNVPEVTVALPDYVFALCALLGSFLLPFAGLYALLRLKRRAVAPAVSRSFPARVE
jgi:hypothetical protein